MVSILSPLYGHGGRLFVDIQVPPIKDEDFIVAVIFVTVFLFCLSQIANKTLQIENTMVTCLHYLIIKLVHHKLYDWGLICRFWSLPGSSSDVLITLNYCRFKRSIKC